MTENVAAAALIFRLPDSFYGNSVKAWIVHGKKFWILVWGAGISGHNRPVMVEIEIPDAARDQQEDDERKEFSLLLHAAVLK